MSGTGPTAGEPASGDKPQNCRDPLLVLVHFILIFPSRMNLPRCGGAFLSASGTNLRAPNCFGAEERESLPRVASRHILKAPSISKGRAFLDCRDRWGTHGAGRPVSSWRWRLGPARFGSYRKPMGVWACFSIYRSSSMTAREFLRLRQEDPQTLLCASEGLGSHSAACKRATSSRAEMRSLRKWLRSASFMVGSSSISTSPALTLCPSRTWIARTTPVSNGWMTLLRPLGMIFPVADATMSILPNVAQASARQNMAR